jgi:hypothetical protein
MSKETTWAWLLEPLMASVQELELVLKPTSHLFRVVLF